MIIQASMYCPFIWCVLYNVIALSMCTMYFIALNNPCLQSWTCHQHIRTRYVVQKRRLVTVDRVEALYEPLHTSCMHNGVNTAWWLPKSFAWGVVPFSGFPQLLLHAHERKVEIKVMSWQLGAAWEQGYLMHYYIYWLDHSIKTLLERDTSACLLMVPFMLLIHPIPTLHHSDTTFTHLKLSTLLVWTEAHNETVSPKREVV